MKLLDAEIIDRKVFFKCLAWLIAMSLFAFATRGFGLSLCLLIGIAAIIGGRAEKIFFVVLMIITLTVANFTVVPKEAIGFACMRTTLVLTGLCMTIKIAGASGAPQLKPFLGLLWYIGFMVFASLSGWSPIISELKLLLFTLIYLAFYCSCNYFVCTMKFDAKTIRGIMLSVAVFFIVGSFLLIPFPGISLMNRMELRGDYSGAVSLFKGMANHSQSLGPIVAGLGAVLMADMLLNVRRASKIHILLLLMVPFLLYKTSSRTAMGTFLAGVLVSFYYLVKARRISYGWRSRAVSTMLLLGILAIFAIVALPSGRRGIKAFIEKRNVELVSRDSQVDIDSLIGARAGKAEECMYNFRQSPFVGNGFQVSVNMQDIKINSLAEAMSAPIEKGFIWAAILEEGGVIGMILFVMFIIGVLATVKKHSSFVGASAFVALIISNTGEFTIFSMTYTGGIMWMLVFVGIALDSCTQNANSNMGISSRGY